MVESNSQIMEDENVYRGYMILRDKSFGTYSVRKVGKGPLPKSLIGAFQNTKLIKANIDSFLDSKD